MTSKGQFISGEESFVIVPHHDLYIWLGPFPDSELSGHMRAYMGRGARSVTIAEAYKAAPQQVAKGVAK